MSSKNEYEFWRYLNNPMNENELKNFYIENKIIYEKCELFNDFTQSLLLIIFDTYLGDEITDKDEQIKHFKWCWDKNISNFKKESIHVESENLYNYFVEFVVSVFYSVKNKNNKEVLELNITKIWDSLFDLNTKKSNSDIDVLLEIYNLFEDSLKES